MQHPKDWPDRDYLTDDEYELVCGLFGQLEINQREVRYLRRWLMLFYRRVQMRQRRDVRARLPVAHG